MTVGYGFMSSKDEDCTSGSLRDAKGLELHQASIRGGLFYISMGKGNFSDLLTRLIKTVINVFVVSG